MSCRRNNAKNCSGHCKPGLRKIWTAIKVLRGTKCKPSWKRMLKNCGHSMKWKEPAVNRMLLAMIKRRTNTFFMTVQRKVLKTEEVFAMTVKRWKQEKKINQKIM